MHIVSPSMPWCPGTRITVYHWASLWPGMHRLHRFSGIFQLKIMSASSCRKSENAEECFWKQLERKFQMFLRKRGDDLLSNFWKFLSKDWLSYAKYLVVINCDKIGPSIPCCAIACIYHVNKTLGMLQTCCQLHRDRWEVVHEDQRFSVVIERSRLSTVWAFPSIHPIITIWDEVK